MPRFDPALLDEIRHAVDISDVIGRRVTWDRRKTNRSKGDFWACCPFHGEGSPSFHAEDRKGRFHCFGCGQSGDHFRFLTELEGISFPQAVEEVASLGGIRMPERGPETAKEREEREKRRKFWEAKRAADQRRAEAETAKRVLSAGGIWKASVPIAGTLAEVYLRERGGAQLATDDPNLRFHPKLRHEAAQVTRPALIGRVQNAAGQGVAVWRIFLKPDGSDKAFDKQSGFNPKMGLGPAAGGAVRLGGEQADVIGIGEGIETSRAARLLDPRFPIWAGLSTSGIAGFEPPPFVRKVLVFPDGDRPRRRDGVDYGPPGMQAGLTLKARLDADGLIECEIVEPPVGGDYLDLWRRAMRRS